jgi:hypothetical protein
VFHGLTAGIVWAGFIALGITCWHVLYGKARSPKSIVRPGGAIVAGAASGFVSSLLVVLMVVGVYTPESLNAMGWIGRETAQALREGAPAPFWTDLFVTYRCGWVYLIQGTGLGVGMALMTNGLLASPRWHALLASGSGQMASFAETLSLVRRIMRIVAPYAWLVPVCVAIASVGAALVPDFSTFALSDQAIAKGAVSKGTFAFLVKGLIGDGLTQSLGAYFGVCGLALGVLVMRRGLALEPRGGNF